jgi:type II secretory pathway pseudopilin PulG
MKTKASQHRHSFGFTLAETLIAATIVSTSLVTVIGLLSSGLSLSQKNSGATVAPVLAKRVVAEILMENAACTRAVPATTMVQPRVVKLYDAALRPVSQSANGNSETTYQQGSAIMNASFLVTWTMVDRAADLGTGMKSLTVFVESPAGRPAKTRQSFTYATLLHL